MDGWIEDSQWMEEWIGIHRIDGSWVEDVWRTDN